MTWCVLMFGGDLGCITYPVFAKHLINYFIYFVCVCVGGVGVCVWGGCVCVWGVCVWGGACCVKIFSCTSSFMCSKSFKLFSRLKLYTWDIKGVAFQIFTAKVVHMGHKGCGFLNYPATTLYIRQATLCL